MKAYYDMHIHSVLSSCADDLQTPNNILNMCMLKELNIISICDHNSAKQYETLELLKDSYDFLLIYGIEMTIKEGFHVLAYFENKEDVMALDKIIDDSLNKSLLPPDDQIVCDEYDEEKTKIQYYLNQPIPYDFKDIIEIVHRLDGVVIPAHIDRKNTGILDFYQDFSIFNIDGIEIYDLNKKEQLFLNKPFLKKYQYINNSDAHSVELIHEKDNYIDIEKLTFSDFKKWLRKE